MAIYTLTRFNPLFSPDRPDPELVTLIQAKIQEMISQGVITTEFADKWENETINIDGGGLVRHSKRLWPTQEIAELWKNFMLENNVFSCTVHNDTEPS